jgi:ligand-binding sensor domain-containing protein/signal transduction histidine kinase
VRVRASVLTSLLVLVELSAGQSRSPKLIAPEEYLVNTENIPFPNFGRANAIMRDRRGFLWFGTSRGLCRYDGYQVRVFSNGPLRKSDQNTVTAIAELSAGGVGSLLLGTNQGLWSFDFRTEEFHRFLPDAHFSKTGITALLRDPDGTLWIGTDSLGLFAYDSTLRRYSTYNGLMNNAVNCLLLDHSGIIWIGMNHGAFQALDRATSRIIHSGTSIAPRGASRHRVVSFNEDGNQDLWIGSDNGVEVFDRKTEQIRHLELQSPLRHTVHSMARDPSGRIWIGASDHDLLFYADSSFSSIPFSDPAGIESQSTALYVDPVASDSAAVLLWVGTRNGVKKIAFKRNPFANHVRNRDGLMLDRGAVLSLTEDRSGILWVGLWGGGLEGFRYRNGRYSRVYHFEPNPASRVSLPHNDVRVTYEDSRRWLWIGTGDGLAALDKRRKRMNVFRSGSDDSTALVSSLVSDIIEDRSGTIWFATDGGISKLESRNPIRFKSYLNTAADVHPYGGNKVSSLHVDRNGTLWAATFGNGLKRYNGDGTFTTYRFPTDSTGLFQNFIYTLAEDPYGVLWLSTPAGLTSFDPAQTAWKTYQIDDLHDTHIHGISVDERGNVWLSMAVGLVRFNSQSGAMVRYDLRSGLAVNDLFTEFARSSRGKLLVGGLNGFVEFSPAEILRTNAAPEIAITSVAVFDKPVASTDLATHEIVLSHDQNYLSISFAALDYTDPLRNGFAYRMEAIDKEWVQAGSRNSVMYAHLDPGSYVFRVKGHNSEGVWNEAGATMKLTITPPYWATWWFRSLVAIAMIAIVTSAYNYRVRQLLKVERLRLRIADDLHDDVGSNLSSISLGSQLALQRTTLDLETRQLIEEIRENAAHTAETMRDIVWLINPKNDQSEDLVLRMRDVAAKLLNGIEYTFITSNVSQRRIADLSIRRNIFLIYKESLNNIARHAHATKVEISLVHAEGRLMLSVKDNGAGFDPAAARNGNGLAGFQRRADSIGAKLDVHSSSGQGTRVSVSVALVKR